MYFCIYFLRMELSESDERVFSENNEGETKRKDMLLCMEYLWKVW